MKVVLQTITILLLQVFSFGCDLHNKTTVSSSGEDQAGIAVPPPIVDFIAAVTNPQAMKATIEVDGQVWATPMNLSQDGTQVSITINNLTMAPHTFQIFFVYDNNDSLGAIKVARSGMVNLDVAAGSNTLGTDKFPTASYFYYDDNGDAISGAYLDSNLYDLSQTPVRDPKRCILGKSQLADTTAITPIEGCRLATVIP